ncbi:MAG: transcription antitermination protein NusB [Erysipelothrix sp.]|jgi:N utilization substance protein B|nr:transcription antitermination protein NusB [Erysipelothrix sp.]
MKRRKQRLTAIVCFYIYLFKNRDIMDILNDFNDVFIANQPDGDFLMVDEATQFMMVEAIAAKDLIIAKINSLLKTGWVFDRLNLVEQAILFMAISELVYEVDERAIIINEAVEIAKIYGDQDSYKMINAILDQV